MGTGKYMNIRGKKLYVETYGNLKNKPVLYLHGGPGESCYDFSFLQKIKDIQNPMLLIVGKHDVVTCEKQIETFNKDAQNGGYIVFEESGHTPHYEEADRFAETVMHFLK